MQLRDRIHLLKRRVHVAGRFRAEHGWSLYVCWQMSRVHQRHMLLLLAAMREEDAVVEQFRAELDRDLDTLTLEGAI